MSGKLTLIVFNISDLSFFKSSSTETIFWETNSCTSAQENLPLLKLESVTVFILYTDSPHYTLYPVYWQSTLHPLSCILTVQTTAFILYTDSPDYTLYPVYWQSRLHPLSCILTVQTTPSISVPANSLVILILPSHLWQSRLLISSVFFKKLCVHFSYLPCVLFCKAPHPSSLVNCNITSRRGSCEDLTPAIFARIFP
jgi:hypothetical protein